MFLGDFVSTMWFSTCCVHPARIGGRGRTRRQNEWDPCGLRVAILVIDAPKRSGGKKSPSVVGISTIYEIAEELA
ncbi:unnamed protein product [Sphagnum tenellum]